jgi:hypothetical protein
MNRAAVARAIRKEQLLRENDTLREDFAHHADGLRPACQASDGAVAGGRWLYAHPQVVIAFSLTFVIAQPKRAWRWARRAFSLWQTWNRVRALIVRYSPV